ncbi:MAG: 3-methyl-2-oxobutanoate hydroxymethyltransferase [Candidatus Rokubacteria bacterium]|nr:3-methyl-2-oxobutanoate hydroxymethyltransferase [Candidatus Rokubacteria bacterium]
METDARTKKRTINEVRRMKSLGEKIVVMTAYDYPMASLVEEAGVEVIFVGGSLGMVVLGYENTIPVTMEDILHHLKAVVRGARRALIVAPLPFGSYHVSNEQAIANAIRLMQAGADSAKTQGAGLTVERVRAITAANIPCVGHAGLTPQFIAKLGGHRAVGKTAEEARAIYDDCLALQDAGAWAIELECVPAALGKVICEKLSIPVISTGSGVDCDGQLLNLYDALGLYRRFKPRFAKQYVNLWEIALEHLRAYTGEVKGKAFPDDAHSIGMPEDELEKFLKTLP